MGSVEAGGGGRRLAFSGGSIDEDDFGDSEGEGGCMTDAEDGEFEYDGGDGGDGGVGGGRQPMPPPPASMEDVEVLAADLHEDEVR